MSLGFWCLLFIGILLSSFGGILFKMAAVEIVHGDLLKMMQQALVNYKLLVGVLLYMVPTFIWIFMLKKVDISFLQPMFSLVYVVTPVLAIMILHEKIPLNRCVGIAVILVGVIIVAKK
jgi:drug/metabolite transporter (DMT)-like permease